MTMPAPTARFDPAMTVYESRYVDAGGIRTHYIEAGSGPPVVLVHGGGPGADGYGNWHVCIPRLAAQFRVIAIDMLGFGRTDKPDPERFTYSQEARTAHLAAVLEALDVGPATLVGNSMGGLTSLAVARERPELVARLVLMGPAGIRTETVPAALQALLGYDGTADGMRAVIRALTHESYVMDDALLEYRVRLSTEPATRRAQAATMAWVRERGGLYLDDEAIAEVRTPALVIGGKCDPIVTPQQIFRFLELLENSWGYLIPHCGHWVMMERPEEFCAVCTRFILQ